MLAEWKTLNTQNNSLTIGRRRSGRPLDG